MQRMPMRAWIQWIQSVVTPLGGALLVIALRALTAAQRAAAGARVRRTLLMLLLVLLLLGISQSTTSTGEIVASLQGRTAQTAPIHTPNDTRVIPGQQPTSHPGSSPQGCAAGQPPQVTQRTPITSAHASARATPAVRTEIALTFDDGPSPTFTPQILAILHAAGAHATFFVVGRHAARSPDLVRAEWENGDAIGNHTYDHNWIPRMSRDQLRANLAATAAAVRAATGDPCLWLFRPPFGTLPQQSPAASELRQEGWATVDWSIDPKDWRRPGARAIAQWVSWHLFPGAIILLHDGAPDGQNADRSQTVAALPLILAALRARGLQAVTLPQLLRDAGIVRPVAPPTAVRQF